MARHTFATTITLTNGVSIETVSKMLGHTSIRTTQIYAKVVENKVSHDMHSLRDVLEAKKAENGEEAGELSSQYSLRHLTRGGRAA